MGGGGKNESEKRFAFGREGKKWEGGKTSKTRGRFIIRGRGKIITHRFHKSVVTAAWVSAAAGGMQGRECGTTSGNVRGTSMSEARGIDRQETTV